MAERRLSESSGPAIWSMREASRHAMQGREEQTGYWVSCRRFTIRVTVQNGRIVEAAPVAPHGASAGTLPAAVRHPGI
jgi:hypothetical protein